MGYVKAFSDGGRIAIAAGLSISILNGLWALLSKSGNTFSADVSAKLGGGE